MDPAIPTRPPAFIQGLTKFPRELVHQVFNDLEIERILQIISHKITYLDSCITSHIRYGRLFRSQADIDSVVDYYILFRDIKRWTGNSLLLDSSLQTYRTPIIGWDYEARLRTFLISSIRTHTELSAPELNVLSTSISLPFPSLPPLVSEDTLPAYWACWNWIKTAKSNLNAEKAAHWMRAADLISAYPGKIVLKKPLDPDQGPARVNTTHIANRFRGIARKILADHTIVYPFSGCRWSIDGLILVPYDRYLWSFLEVVRIHPPENKDEDFEETFKELSLDDPSIRRNARYHLEATVKHSNFQYPENIATSLKIVMDGLAQVYTGSPLRVVPRIRWPSSPPGGNIIQPTFLIYETPPAGIHLCPRKRRTPHDSRELEWLEAFLKVVTWMEENKSMLLGKEDASV